MIRLMNTIAPLPPNKPKPTIGVVGLGTMGLGIVQVFLMAGFQVVATDGYAPLVTAAPMRLAASLDARMTLNLRPWLAANNIAIVDERLQGNTLAACNLLTERVARLRGAYVRNRLIELVERSEELV